MNGCTNAWYRRTVHEKLFLPARSRPGVSLLIESLRYVLFQIGTSRLLDKAPELEGWTRRRLSHATARSHGGTPESAAEKHFCRTNDVCGMGFFLFFELAGNHTLFLSRAGLGTMLGESRR